MNEDHMRECMKKYFVKYKAFFQMFIINVITDQDINIYHLVYAIQDNEIGTIHRREELTGYIFFFHRSSVKESTINFLIY